MGGPPLDELVKTMSEQAVVVAREQVDLARREMTGKVRQAGAGAAMIGGGAVLAALASGTATAGLVLLLSGRARNSAAALGVSGAYMGAGALLAREGLARLREAGPLVPQETVQTAKRATKKPARKPAASKPRPRRPQASAKRGPGS